MAAAPPLPPPGWSQGRVGEGRREIWCGCAEPAPDLAARGWRLRHVEDDLRLRVPPEVAPASPPPGLRLVPWAEAEPGEAFDVYERSFRARPGFPGWPRERWLAWGTGHPAFRPDGSALAREDGAAIGFLLLAVEPPGDRGPDPEAWVVQMGVVPERRRRGVARLLLRHALHAARAAGAAWLHLSVNVDNPEAHALYVASGFRFHRRRAVYLPRGDLRSPSRR